MMEQNAQNGAFYPPAYNFHHHAFTSSEDPSSFLSSGYPAPGYAPPSAPSSTTQGFHMMEPVQDLDYGKPHEERETCNIVTNATSDSTTKINADDLFQAFDSVNKRLLQLENTVQGLELSIEGLKRAEKEKHTESNDKLSRLELLIKEVLTGVQHFNDIQKLDGAVSQMRKLQVVDKKTAVGEETQKTSTERWQHPNESQSCVEPPATSEDLTPHVPVLPLPPHYSEAPPPPQSQNYGAPHSVLTAPPSMNEPGKPTIQHSYAPPLPSGPPQLPPSSGQSLPPQHSMQVPLYPYQAQARASLQTPPPQGLSNPLLETTFYGPMQMHPQYTEPLRPPTNSYSEIPQYYSGGAPQEVSHPSPQFSSSGSHAYESTAGMVGIAPPYVQSRLQVSPPASIYEMPNNTGYSPYRTAQPVPSTTSAGGGSHSKLPKAQSVLPASNGVPVASAFASRHQVNEVTEKVITMGFSREQVRAAVQGLTDIGQPVDMNTVLDKLMNRGESTGPQRNWYGRG